jgi:hypothetical protein
MLKTKKDGEAARKSWEGELVGRGVAWRKTDRVRGRERRNPYMLF